MTSDERRILRELIDHTRRLQLTRQAQKHCPHCGTPVHGNKIYCSYRHNRAYQQTIRNQMRRETTNA